MKNDSLNSRRKFLQQIGVTSFLAAASPLSSLAANCACGRTYANI